LKLFGRALLAVPVALVLQSTYAAAEGRLFGSAGGIGGLQYYEVIVRKMQKDGEVFFGVDGYGAHPGQSARMNFRALFNCGNRSKIAVVIENAMRNEYLIQDQVKNEGTARGIWYSLQSHHCPDNHHIRSPNDLWN
jgi:hypothetical protein